MSHPFDIGIDIGQSIDPTAIAIVQRVDVAADTADRKPHLHCSWLQRLPLGMLYPAQVAHIERLYRREPVHGHARLALDITGVGRPIGDIFMIAGLRPERVMITGSEAGPHTDERGIHYVPKGHLVSTLVGLQHERRLHIAADLPDALALEAEMQDFQQNVTDTGRWRFGARSGSHDDLLLALALGAWLAFRKNPLNIDPGVVARSAMIGRRWGDVAGGGAAGGADHYQAQRGASGVFYESWPSRRGW